MGFQAFRRAFLALTGGCFRFAIFLSSFTKTMNNLLMFLGLLGSVTALSLRAAGQPGETLCYELRTYYAAPGKLDALNARFRNHTMRIFEKHGMVNIGYWMPVDNPENKLIYLLAFPGRDAAKQSWKDFGADPDWQKAARESEANGRLVTKVESVFLKATDYSPQIKSSKAGESRLFELRTYTATPGKLDNLNARFREHTCKLFEKHGMANFGYWTPLDADKGAGNTLIYLVAHKNREASDASWNGLGGREESLRRKSRRFAHRSGRRQIRVHDADRLFADEIRVSCPRIQINNIGKLPTENHLALNAAWRSTVESWLRRQGMILVRQNRNQNVSTNFPKNWSHN